MRQKVQVILTLEVDSSQSLEDIKSFVNHAIDKRAIQHRIESKPYYCFKKVEKIEEKIEE